MPAAAQRKSAPAPQPSQQDNPWTQIPVPRPSEQDSPWTQIEKLDWRFGPTQGKLRELPQSPYLRIFAFLGLRERAVFWNSKATLATTTAIRLLRATSVGLLSSPSTRQGTCKTMKRSIPTRSWRFLKKSNASANEEKKRRGLEPLVLEDWYIVPHYGCSNQTSRMGDKASSVFWGHHCKLYDPATWPQWSNERNSSFRTCFA